MWTRAAHEAENLNRSRSCLEAIFSELGELEPPVIEIENENMSKDLS